MFRNIFLDRKKKLGPYNFGRTMLDSEIMSEILIIIIVVQIKIEGAVRGCSEILDINTALIIGPPGGTNLSTNAASPTVW